MFSYRRNHFMMKYTIVILLLIAQIWVSTPLFADQEKVKKIIAFLEDHKECLAIIGLAAQKDYRLKLQYEVDYDLYSSKNIEKAINASIVLIPTQKCPTLDGYTGVCRGHRGYVRYMYMGCYTGGG